MTVDAIFKEPEKSKHRGGVLDYSNRLEESAPDTDNISAEK